MKFQANCLTVPGPSVGTLRVRKTDRGGFGDSEFLFTIAADQGNEW